MKLFQVSHISKRFYSSRALVDVDFDLEAGEVLAVAGENGAGKSTLMNIILGIYKPDEGQMFLEGEPYQPKDPHDALNKGISMIHQELRLVPSMTVADNVWIGRVRQFSSGGIYFPERCVNATQELFDEYGIHLDPREKVNNLSVAQMQMVELARAISYRAKIVIMDEPTSALSDKEVAVLYRVTRQLTKSGTAVVFISHKLEEVFEIASRVTILRDGRHISTRPVAEVTMNDLINGIAGRQVENLYPKIDIPHGGVVLKVDNISRSGQYLGISFEVRAGEVLGFAGLVGAGRTEIMNGIYGIDPIESGSIYLEGKPIRNKSPRQALDNGIAMLTEDRLRRGIISKMNVKMNMSLAYFYKICQLSFIDRKREEADTLDMAKTLRVKTAGIHMPIWSLSGGNQQKVMVGRSLLTRPKVLIMDEPTRGVDVGAKSEIYQYCNELAAQGMAIILISSDLPEVMGMSDRMLVIRDGRIVGEHARGAATAEQVMAAMFGLGDSKQQQREDCKQP